ncbi:hypothetical protein HYPSUDRAFT_55701 [Hypholoma sublateritium FD-334 SS-4]|uniref:Uncharacterized protein n=1 Tax=Hypholoma sublateritium (strain FD-334 SS-4) TaxID=945553 RepID=A0A0D2NQI6_HYPSF|nr:hypothetical protein HYPSUDRAFT_55701 [Hypholoma sublateritium FD-334 SS-4]
MPQNQYLFSMDSAVKPEPVALAIPAPAPAPLPPNHTPEHTDSEMEDDTDSEQYLDEIVAKVHDLLVLLRNSRAKEVERRRKQDRQLERARTRLRLLDSQIRNALRSAQPK